jgi:hypothetical protein
MNSYSFFKTILFTTILFSLISSIAIAAIDVNTYTPSRDFSLTSSYDKVSICSCSIKYDSFTVTNTGTWPAIFSITTNTIKSRFTLSQNSFELNPGESQEVFIYITADCSRGSEKLQITVTSNLGPQKTLNKEIVRERCQNIEMWIGNYTHEIKPCEPVTIEINTHNIGPFSENYIISSNQDKYIKYNANAFSLEPGQYSTITATAEFDCSVYGKKEIIFTVQSAKNNLKASLSTQLNIIQDYDYSFTIEGMEGNQDIGVCNRVTSKIIPVSITNYGSVPNNYDVSFNKLPKNIKIVGLTENKFSLNPGESKTFELDVDSRKYRYQNKLKTFTITVNPKYGDIVKKSLVTLNYLACYEHQVIIYDGSKTKNRPLETCANYDYEYDVEIINNGRFRETYELALIGAPEGVSLSQDKISINPGSRDSIKLFIKGLDTNDLYNFKVSAKIFNGIIESDNTWIRSSDTQICHDTLIGRTSKNNYRIHYETESINIPVKNKGMTDNAYIVSWDGSRIIDHDEYILNLAKGEVNSITLNIDSEDKDEGIYEGTIILKDASKAQYNKDIKITLKDKTLVRKAFEYLAFGNICRQVSLIGMITILFIIALIISFLIKGPHYPYNFKSRLKAKMSVVVFLTAIFLIGLILVVLIAGIPKSNTEIYELKISDSDLEYEWLQDKKFQLDVSKFFYDPEDGALRYEVSGLDNIKATVNGNLITFYPDRKWSGTEYAEITAHDKMGGSVTSPEFKLTVVNVPKKTNLELYNIYCWYVNLAIFAIILSLVFIAVFVKQKKRTRK